MSFFTNFIHFTGIPSQCYKEVKQKKVLTDWKGKEQNGLYLQIIWSYV